MRAILVTVLLLIASYGRGQNDSIPPVEKEFDFIRELLGTQSIGWSKYSHLRRSQNRKIGQIKYSQ